MYKGLIYKITNTVNGKIYIGQTINKLEYRLTGHKKACNLKRYDSRVLYLDMRVYGTDKFIIEELEQIECLTELERRAKLNERECWWAVNLSAFDRAIGYNQIVCNGKDTIVSDEYRQSKAECGRGEGVTKYREEHREQFKAWGESMKDSPKWKAYLESVKPYKPSELRTKRILEKLSKPIIQCTLEGEYIATHPSIAQASRSTGVSIDGIKNYLQGKTLKPRHYTWKLETTK